MLSYDFGPQHPLKPERLRRAVALAEHFGFVSIDPGSGKEADPLRVHSREYVEAVKRISDGNRNNEHQFGFGNLDNPSFTGMYEASLAYTAGSVAAARAVVDGAELAISLSGGLHHARRAQASGFCIFNDAAVAAHILRERFDRVAYVDIDVHHGDGVQWLFYDDPSVLTCSIHQDGRTIYPGTGGVEEVGTDFSSFNVPLVPNTTGDVWLEGFALIEAALKAFAPEAIVLQMGTDSHFADPLARIRNTAQEWLEAVRRIRDFGVPVVAVGGGGYKLTTVPRMWLAACLVLTGQEVPLGMPEPYVTEWGMSTIANDELPLPRRYGEEALEKARNFHEREVLPNIGLRT